MATPKKPRISFFVSKGLFFSKKKIVKPKTVTENENENVLPKVRQGSPKIVQEFNKSSEKNQEKYQNIIENSEESPEILQESSHDLSTNSVDPDADTESEGIQEAIDPWGNVDTEFTSTTIVQKFSKSSEKNQEKYQNIIENSEESPEILQESSHDLSTNSVDPDADTESEGIQEAIDPWGDIDTDFMSLPEKEIQEIKSFSKEKEVSKEKAEENQEKDVLVRRPLLPQNQAFQSFLNLSARSSSRKRKKNKKFQVQNWNAKGNTDVFQKIDGWQNKEADGQTGGTSNSYTQYGLY